MHFSKHPPNDLQRRQPLLHVRRKTRLESHVQQWFRRRGVLLQFDSPDLVQLQIAVLSLYCSSSFSSITVAVRKPYTFTSLRSFTMSLRKYNAVNFFVIPVLLFSRSCACNQYQKKAVEAAPIIVEPSGELYASCFFSLPTTNVTVTRCMAFDSALYTNTSSSTSALAMMGHGPRLPSMSGCPPRDYKF